MTVWSLLGCRRPGSRHGRERFGVWSETERLTEIDNGVRLPRLTWLVNCYVVEGVIASLRSFWKTGDRLLHSDAPGAPGMDVPGQVLSI